ncbi:type I-G CRISPR-associated protein Cas7 [Gordonia sp. FQ]|uniref:type I-G CRISPR-associated protein Cas7 n=1 Tax=Gordonia sp. FQ TaxID=3446634 RepID=UPI003F845CF0
MSDLYENIRAIIDDPRSAALVTESGYTPASGPGKPIAPPTYAGDEPGKSRFAYTDAAFIPVADERGWHSRIRRDEQGSPVTAPQVVVNSTPAESGRAEEAAWMFERRIDPEFRWPGITVTKPAQAIINAAIDAAITKTKVGSDTAERIRAEALDVFDEFEVSTWTLAHRQADAWIKYANDPGGKQIWQGGTIRELITRAGASDGDTLYSNFVNAGTFGMWLSSGVARRHRIPRAYSSEIVGFEARPIQRAATKLDVAGGAARETALNTVDGELVEAKGHKPSDMGFGPVPTSPHDAAFACGSVLQQGSISLPVFRSFQFGDDRDRRKQSAAAAVFTLLAITGHELAAESGFLRSECNLVRESARWGWRRASATGASGIEELDVPDADTAAAALLAAVEAAAEVGLQFADPITVQMSPVQAAVVAERVARETAKSTGSDE